METMLVKNPMPRPDYVFYDQPSVMDMRLRAVQAINDFLSIKWTTHKKIAHNKKGAVSHKRFIYDSNTIHAGLPYADGGKGLFQFYEFYNPQTGRLDFFGTPEEFNLNIGGTCGCGVVWSWATVCHSLTCVYANYYMTPMNGCYPVSGYKIPENIDHYKEYGTDKIIEDNGVERIVEAYTKIQPADAVCTSPKDHTMMCIDYPVVERDENGSIDLDKSYVMIADQRGGNGVDFYVKREDDDLIHYSGRTDFKYTFRMLLNEYYIPVTPKEFTGEIPYERAKVGITAACTTKEELIAASVTCNYPMAVIKLIATRKNGYKEMVGRYIFNRVDPHTGVARLYPLENLAEEIKAAEGVKLDVEVTASNGEIITVASIDL